jgi:hypothetical protein
LLRRVQDLVVPITITVSFYVFGFFITAELLGLSGREIVIGLVSGTIGGITTLAAVLHQAKAAEAANELPSAAA